MAIAAPEMQSLDDQHDARQKVGAPGRNRTGMALRPTDFKSVASTNSATGAGVVRARMYAIVRARVLPPATRSPDDGWPRLTAEAAPGRRGPPRIGPRAPADERRCAGRRTRASRLASRTPWVRRCRDSG